VYALARIANRLIRGPMDRRPKNSLNSPRAADSILSLSPAQTMAAHGLIFAAGAGVCWLARDGFTGATLASAARLLLPHAVDPAKCASYESILSSPFRTKAPAMRSDPGSVA